MDLRSPKCKYSIRPLSGVKFLVIHHSGVDGDQTSESIAKYHIETKGWPGIGYHIVVHPCGICDWVTDFEYASYNVASRNHECIGLCLTGNFNKIAPGALQLSGARLGIQKVREICPQVLVVGHKDIALQGFETNCPGDTWPSWRSSLI